MENSNRPVQRVTPIRSEYTNRLENNLNLQSSSSLSDFSSCNQNNLINNVNVQQFKINNNSNNTAISNQSPNILDSLPFLQQNVNIMNINLPNNATIIQNVPQDSLSIQNSNFTQPLSNQKTLIQLSDGRLVQFAQNLQQTTQQMPTTILVQMPYKVFDQNLQKTNQNSINKKFLLPSKTVEKQSQNIKSLSLGNGNTINVNSDLILASSQIDQTQQLLSDCQRNIKDQMNNPSFDQKPTNQTNILNVDKYHEICDILHNKKLLTKLNTNEETVLVEFRLNQQKYQLRMTRIQKVEMEKILVSVGNQQRQMEILQVYQAEQRKMMQQRTSVVLNQMVKKTPQNIVCNKPQIHGLNIAKQVYPINSVLLAVPQSQYGETNFIQTSAGNQSKNISIQPTASQSSNGILLAARLPLSQTPGMLPSTTTIKDSSRETLIRQKRNFKTPNTAAPPAPSFREFLPNANANNEMKPARSRRYNNMRKVLLDDYNAVLMPNPTKPFTDLNDVIQRLMPYHILEESKDQRTNEVDRILKNAFSELDKKCANLKRITSALSMNKIVCDKKSIIIKRMRLDLEKDVFEHEKLLYVNSDENHWLHPLQFDEDGNGFPIPIETPVVAAPPVTICEDEDNAPENIEMNLPEALFSTAGTSVSESMDDNVVVNDITDNLQDSLCHYDIQDISIDSMDSPISECEWNIQDKDSMSSEIVGNPQSEDPDLDAAIKSILF